MKKEHIAVISVLFITSLCFYLLYKILAPFLEAIFWAILLAMVSYPIFKKLQRVLKQKVFLSAIIMTLLVILVIVIPFTLLMASLANEVVGTYNSVEEMIKTGSLQASCSNDLGKTGPILRPFSNATVRLSLKEPTADYYVPFQSVFKDSEGSLHIPFQLLLHPSLPLLSL
jgi:predicted PurR-regulated permease PerM